MSVSEASHPLATAGLPPVEPPTRPAARPIGGRIAPAMGSRRRWRWPALAGVVLAALLAYAGQDRFFGQPSDQKTQLFTVARRSFPVLLQEKGELKAAKSIEIRSEIEGRATIISLIEEGTQAKKGDLLVELASDEITEKLRDAEIREANAQAALEAAIKELEILQDENASKIRKAELDLRLAEMGFEKYKEGEAAELRQTAELAHEEAKSVLERAKDTLKDSEELFKQSFLTRLELENDRFAAYKAELAIRKAKLGVEVLEKYTIPMAIQEKESKVVEARKELDRTRKSAVATEAKSAADVAARRSELQLIQEKLAKLRDQKQKSRIVAPADGLVVYARGDNWWRSESQIEKGTQVHERQSLIELPDTSSMKVVLRVHEAKTEQLKLDLPATVEIEGLSGRKFTGKVSKIAVLANSQNRWLNPNLKEYETEVLLDGQFTDLKPGLTAHVEIVLAQLGNVVAVPVQTVFAKGNDYYVFVDRSGSAEPVKVEIGLASSEYIEIKKGLTEGDRVYLAVTDEMKLKLPDGNDTGELPEPKGKRGGSKPKPPTTQTTPAP